MEQCDWHSLQRLDLHLAELHNASAPLKGDGPAAKLAVLDIDGLDAIEHDGKARAFNRGVSRASGRSLLSAPRPFGQRLFGSTDGAG